MNKRYYPLIAALALVALLFLITLLRASEAKAEPVATENSVHICASILAARLSKISSMHTGFLVGKRTGV